MLHSKKTETKTKNPQNLQAIILNHRQNIRNVLIVFTNVAVWSWYKEEDEEKEKVDRSEEKRANLRQFILSRVCVFQQTKDVIKQPPPCLAVLIRPWYFLILEF